MKALVSVLTILLLLAGCNLVELPDVDISGANVEGYYKNGKFYIKYDAEDVLIEMDFSGVSGDVPKDDTYTIGTDVRFIATAQDQDFDGTGTITISNSVDADNSISDGIGNTYDLEVNAECSNNALSLISDSGFKITGTASVTQIAAP